MFSCRLNGKRRYKNTQQEGKIASLDGVQDTNKGGVTNEEDRNGCSSVAKSDEMSSIANVSNPASACLAKTMDGGHTENVQSGSGPCVGKKAAHARQGEHKPRRSRTNTTKHNSNKKIKERRLSGAC